MTRRNRSPLVPAWFGSADHDAAALVRWIDVLHHRAPVGDRGEWALRISNFVEHRPVRPCTRAGALDEV